MKKFLERKTRQRFAVLSAIAAAPGEIHGYEICKAAKVSSGTLYPMLMQFEASGDVQSEWEKDAEDGRPRRRYYRLTPTGLTKLAEYEDHFAAKGAVQPV